MQFISMENNNFPNAIYDESMNYLQKIKMLTLCNTSYTSTQDNLI